MVAAMSPMKKRPKLICGCPPFAKSKRLINHTLACLVARRGSLSVDEFYGTSNSGPRRAS